MARLLALLLVVAVAGVSALHNYEYSKPLALALGRLSRIVVCDQPSDFALAKDFPGLRLYAKSVAGVQHAFVGYYWESNSIVVVFEGSKLMGTSAETDHFFGTNLEVGPSKSYVNPGWKVHTGFQKQWHAHKAALWRPLLIAISHMMPRTPPLRIYLTGYSLGGALATLAAAELMQYHPPLAKSISLITFAQPRVGNQAFADAVNQADQVMRITVRTDPIVNLPFKWMGDFVHAGVQYDVNMAGDLQHVCNTDGDSRCGGREKGDVKHHMAYYGLGFFSKCSADVDGEVADLDKPFATFAKFMTEPIQPADNKRNFLTDLKSGWKLITSQPVRKSAGQWLKKKLGF